MSLMDRIKRVFTDTETVTYTYECPECEARFESAKHNPAEVWCPECGASGVDEVEDTTVTA